MKIVFDLEEFKIFLKELDEIEYDTGCHSTYDIFIDKFELDEKGNIYSKRYGEQPIKKGVKSKLICEDLMIKGEIIDDET